MYRYEEILKLISGDTVYINECDFDVLQDLIVETLNDDGYFEKEEIQEIIDNANELNIDDFLNINGKFTELAIKITRLS